MARYVMTVLGGLFDNVVVFEPIIVISLDQWKIKAIGLYFVIKFASGRRSTAIWPANCSVCANWRIREC